MTGPLFRWVVEAPLQLGELLSRHGLARALDEGRVFVDGRRVVEPQALRIGATVQVFAPRPSAVIEILLEADGVFAIDKPAELPTEPDKSGSDCVIHQLAERSKIYPADLFAVSRLDVGVSGVLLVAAHPAAQKRLLQERTRGTLRRHYIALGCGVPEPAEGQWRDALRRGGAGKRVVDDRDGQPAHSRYRVVASASPVGRDRPPTSLLSLSPITGRTHQLRVHASTHGAALLGDRRYSGPSRLTIPDGSVQPLSRVMLHAVWVEWGSKAERRRVASEPAAELVDTWLALGGEAAALQRALD
jgi:tRNA pseudouridine32 synthase / 23S rRNA pseudouridine746 synthase